MDQSAASNDLLFETRDGIGKVTFNRPQARNAFTFEMYEGLAKICEQADGDRAIKVLVLRGAGDKAFAAGTDINQFRAFTTPEQAIEYEARLDRVLTKIEQCRVPTIAAISGACTGGGLLNEVVEDMAALERRAEELAALIASHAPLTLAATKQALLRLQRPIARDEDKDLILMCYMSGDFREGLDAFLTKRAPHWTGE
jgi:enoyl-CoA hydratase/carnithine racemase